MTHRKDVNAGCDLLAVLLITRSRPGPKLVFHYPVQPILSEFGDGRDCSDGDTSDSDSENDHTRVAGANSGAHHDGFDVQGAIGGLSLGGNGSACDDERVFGYRLDSLEKLLSPERWSDGKKFEVCLNGLTFVGHPVYASQDGLWSSGQPGRDSSTLRGEGMEDSAATMMQPGRPSAENDGHSNEALASITVTEPDTPGTPVRTERDFTHIADSFDSKVATSLGTSFNSASSNSGAATEQIQMFHVVFALRLTDQTQARRVYQHVAKTLSRALHFCQKQSSYVANESKKIVALRQKARQAKMSAEELLTQTIMHSELAWALKEIYDRISIGEVAGIRLSGTHMSLQLPSHGSEAAQELITALSPHDALLLLENKDSLLVELQHPDASPLAYLIRELTPTKSLQKHATNLSLPLKDITYLADHLIKWRKARAISPLHPRNLYTTHPNAPNHRIMELAAVYSRQFSGLPPLPQMLKMLSGRPIQYGLLIPSRDHRGPFMDLLAFLVRHDFVAQLKTYGWLRCSPPASTNNATHAWNVADDAESVSSRQTAIADERSHEDHDPNKHLILDASNPTTEEAVLLMTINESLADTEVGENLHHLLPYLDGEHALENVAAQAGVKRAKAEEWLAMLGSKGFLTTFRSL